VLLKADRFLQVWMRLASSTETSVNLCHSMRRYAPEARNVQTQQYMHPLPHTYCLHMPVEKSLMHSPPESNRTHSFLHASSLQFALYSELDIAVLQT
jgi:hypothetical protein